MNDQKMEKWKITENTEILDDDFLDTLDSENKKRYPSNTNKTEEIELLSDCIEDTIEAVSLKEKRKNETVEILNDQLDVLNKTSKTIIESIEILNDHPVIKKQTINILNDQLEEIHQTSKTIEESIEVLKSDTSEKQTIDQLHNQLQTISSENTKENIDETKKTEEVELLEEEIQTFKLPSENLGNTIELLDIVSPKKPLQIKNQVKPKKKPWIILLVLCIIIILFFIYKAFFWQQDSIKTNKQIETIVKTTKTKESFIKKENIAGAATLEDDRYFNYLDVDFSNLVKQNSDVKGWLKVNNTNINYPFVQAEDNDFYLKHSFDKSYNTAGWVFADFRNNLETLDQNTIIYAHGRLDNTMFGSLKKIMEKNWYENMENEFLQMSTLNSNTIWQVFSIYTIEPETYYITPNFENEDLYQTFLTKLKERSVHDFQVELNPNDKILTLSSCYNDALRIVLHAKLVNIEEKTKN